MSSLAASQQFWSPLSGFNLNMHHIVKERGHDVFSDCPWGSKEEAPCAGGPCFLARKPVHGRSLFVGQSR